MEKNKSENARYIPKINVNFKFEFELENFIYQPVAVAEWLACLTAEWEVSLWVQHPTSAEILAIYTSKGVAPEVNFREHISHMPLSSVNKVAHSREDITRSPKQGYQWLQNGHVSPKIKTKSLITCVSVKCRSRSTAWRCWMFHCRFFALNNFCS